jgi:hypothetical protein
MREHKWQQKVNSMHNHESTILLHQPRWYLLGGTFVERLHVAKIFQVELPFRIHNAEANGRRTTSS